MDSPVPPRPASILRRWFPVWRRNLLFWRKLAVPSVLGNFGEPVLYLLALGYGLGGFIGQIQGLSYIVFLASGIVCSSAMVSATFEATYSAYTRMAVQDTWDAITTTPLGVSDVVVGEVMWAATKGVINATAILIVATVVGAVSGAQAVLALPVVLLAGIGFAGMAMVVTAVARGYDFFLYYTTLGMTPMFMLGGVFFPVERMPEAIQSLAAVLPLTHAVALVRPLVTGASPPDAMLHLSVLLAYAVGALAIAVRLAVRRLST